MSTRFPVQDMLPLPLPSNDRSAELLGALRATLLEASQERPRLRAGLTIIGGEPGAGRSTAVMCALKDLAVSQRPLYVRLERNAEEEDVLSCLHRVLMRVLGTTDGQGLKYRDVNQTILDLLTVCEAQEEPVAVVVDAPWQTNSLWLLCDMLSRYAFKSSWIVLLDRRHFRQSSIAYVEVPWPGIEEKRAWLEGLLCDREEQWREAFLIEHRDSSFAQMEQQLEHLWTPGQTICDEERRFIQEFAQLSRPVKKYVQSLESSRLMELEARGILHRRQAPEWRLTEEAHGLVFKTPLLTLATPGPLYELFEAYHESALASDALKSYGRFELANMYGESERREELTNIYRRQWFEHGLAYFFWARQVAWIAQGGVSPEHHLLECALFTMDGKHLGAIKEPMTQDVTTQMLWMGVVLERGELQEAFTLFERHRDQLDAREAFLVHLELLGSRAKFEHVLELTLDHELEEELSPGQHFFMCSTRVLSLTWLQHIEEALEQGRVLQQRMFQAVAHGKIAREDMYARFAWINLARAFHLCQALKLALESVAQIVGMGESEDTLLRWFYPQAAIDYLEALLKVDHLELQRAEQLLGPLSIRYAPEHALGFHVHQLYTILPYFQEKYEEFEARHALLHQAHQRRHESWNVLHIYAVRARAHQLGWEHVERLGSRDEGRLLSLNVLSFNFERALRLGHDASEIASLKAQIEQHTPMASFLTKNPAASILYALQAPGGGEHREHRLLSVRDALLKAYGHAEEQGHKRALLNLERALALCNMLLGQWLRAVHSWRAVAEWAAHCQSEPLQQLAEKLALWMESPRDFASIWEESNTVMHLSKEQQGLFGRILRGLLGEHRADSLERAMVEELAHRQTWHIKRARLLTSSELPRVWLDSQSHEFYVSSSGGLRGTFPVRGTQAKLLQALIKGDESQPDGVCHKEYLLMEVWGVDDYHPLHHENRLRMAIFKLRKVFKDVGCDEESAPLIETLDDGYRLGADLALIHHASLTNEPGL